MRLLHFADLHLGMENYGSFDTRTGLSTRVRDYLRVFDQVVDYAIAEQVDAVLFAGDAFKNRDPSPTIQREFAKRVHRLASAGLPAVLLVGNHDLPSVEIRATALDIYQILDIPGVVVARKPDLITLETRSGPLQVGALPWLTRQNLLTPEEQRNPDRLAVTRRMAEQISSLLDDLVQSIDPSIPAVLLAHLSIEGAKLGAEQSIMLGEDLVVGSDELRASAFDYVALGHIHQHQVISAHPPTVYSGSIERIDFGEESEDKGFVTVDIEAAADGRRETSFEFHPVDARRFVTLRVKATDEEPMEDVRSEVERHASQIKGAIVRTFIALPPEREALLRVEDVRRLLLETGATYVAKIARDVDLQTRPRVEIDDHETLDPIVMLDKWLGLRNLSADQRRKVLEAGTRLIQAERARSD